MSIVGKIIGSLVIKIGLDAAALDQGKQAAEKNLKDLDKTAGATVASVAKIGVAAAVAGAALFAGLASKSLATIDAQSKLARQLGGTTAAVQTLQRHADLAGVSSEGLAKSIQALNQRLGEAIRDGASPAAEALKRLKLSADELSRMDADERMIAIADAMKQANLNASQQADILRDLGIRNKEVFNMLEDGGAAIRAARQDIEDFGIAVSDIDSTQIEVANDAVTSMGMLFQGVGNQLAVALAPALAHVATLFTEMSRTSGGFGEIIRRIIDGMVVGFGVIPSTIHAIRLIWDETMAAIVDGINFIIRGWNKLAAMLPQGFLIASEEIRNDWGNLRSEIGEAPSMEDWEEWWEGVKIKSREAAEAVVEARKHMVGAPGADSDVMTDAEMKKAQREQQRLDAQLEQLRTHLATKEEAEHISYQNSLLALDDFYNRKMISESQYQEMIERARQKHEENIAEIRQRAIDQELRARADMANRVAGLLNAMGSMITRDGEKNFAAGKAISIAVALVKGWEAVVSSYARGADVGGPPLGMAYAAMAAAQTAAQIASMRSVSTGGGGGSPSAGGGAAEPAPVQASAPIQGGTLVIQGLDRSSLYGGDAVRDIAEGLADFFGDGGSAKGKRIVFA